MESYFPQIGLKNFFQKWALYLLTFLTMFKWRIISRSNVNGKVHTFQKDFDDYDTYQEFITKNPEYDTTSLFRGFWNPWSTWESLFPVHTQSNTLLPANTKHLPEGVNLEKYEKRRLERRQSEAEKAEKRHSLEQTQSYLKNYLEENPDDSEAKDDLTKIEKELASL